MFVLSSLLYMYVYVYVYVLSGLFGETDLVESAAIVSA